jgi:hypothetical protein
MAGQPKKRTRQGPLGGLEIKARRPWTSQSNTSLIRPEALSRTRLLLRTDPISSLRPRQIRIRGVSPDLWPA